MIRKSLLAIFLSMCSVVAWAAPGDQNWAPMGDGVNGTVWAIAVSGGNTYVGGSFTSAGGIAVNNIARWDGNNWSALSSGVGVIGDTVYALVIDSNANLYAGSNSGVFKWDGSVWSTLSAGYTTQLAISTNNTIYRTAEATCSPGGFPGQVVQRWMGSAWSTISGCEIGHDLLTGGNNSDYYTKRGGWSDILKNGSIISSALNGSSYDLVVDINDNLYAGGAFTKAGTTTVNHIAKWNGSSWSSLGLGVNGDVNEMAVGDNNLVYASGPFTSAGGVAANGIAKWDGSNWSALGSGINGYQVRALVIDNKGDLYVGGNFSSAGGITVSNIVKWAKPVIGDFNHDLTSDLLTRSSSLGTWTRYTIQNAAITGTGSMNAYTSSSVQYVAQLDANGDGDADILTRNTSTGAWYLHEVQSGAVTSTAPIYLYANLDQQFIGTGDFNNDGTDDVMLRSTSAGYYTVFLLSNHGVNSTVFYNAWTSSASVPQGVGDFDGDGTDDLLVRRTSDNLYFIFKTTNGGVANVTCACNLWANPDWTFQFAGDTNKDGTDDIVIRGTGASADGKWWNFRMSNFSSAETTNLNTFLNKTQVSFAASGDYNGDGYTDMLIRVNNGPVYVAKIVNGVVSGSTSLLTNLPSDQVVLK